MDIIEDLKQRLENAIKKAEINLTIDRHEFEKAKRRLKDREEEEQEPIRAILAEFLDTTLVDMHGTPILNNYIITTENRHPSYVVKSRGMQFLNGTPLHNPSVKCLRYSALDKKIISKKIIEFYPSELKTMLIVGEYTEIIKS